MACHSPSDSYDLDIQGHRGCRGHWPENSIPGMLRALDMGVTTLEMDAVITADSQVILSHEPFFSPEICLDPSGQALPEDSAEAYNIFRFPYAEVQAFDCGSKPHPRFPNQQKLVVHKPLLSEVIDSVEAYRAAHGLPAVDFNIETKCQPAGDNRFHPEPEAFVDLLMGVIDAKGVRARCIIQSFDPRTLQVMHARYPDVRLALLVENEDGFQANLDRLGFVPDIYSPDHQLVDQALCEATRAQGMTLIPWTANEPADIQRLLDLQVEGIISDYPDRVVALFQKK
ncbi:MAG: glycerophosphodiester phosphodiesterase [Bacteroidetes bacterium]|nr:MAG: glycerophosphodiester phosphodiesterase [Bacteroidota bacterium]